MHQGANKKVKNTDLHKPDELLSKRQQIIVVTKCLHEQKVQDPRG